MSPPFRAQWVRECAAKEKCLMGGQILPAHAPNGGGPDLPAEEAVFVSRSDKRDPNGKEARVILHKVCAIARGLHVPEPVQQSIDDFLA